MVSIRRDTGFAKGRDLFVDLLKISVTAEDEHAAPVGCVMMARGIGSGGLGRCGARSGRTFAHPTGDLVTNGAYRSIVLRS